MTSSHVKRHVWSEVSGGIFFTSNYKTQNLPIEKDEKVDWKTIERLEDELNKFSSHDDILSRFPGVCDSDLDGIGLNPAEAVAQREHVQSEQPDVKSWMGIYQLDIYIYSKMKRWRNTVAAFTNHHSFQPKSHGPNNAFWPLPATPVILAAVVASGSCDGAWIALAWPSSCVRLRVGLVGELRVSKPFFGGKVVVQPQDILCHFNGTEIVHINV